MGLIFVVLAGAARGNTPLHRGGPRTRPPHAVARRQSRLQYLCNFRREYTSCPEASQSVRREVLDSCNSDTIICPSPASQTPRNELWGPFCHLPRHPLAGRVVGFSQHQTTCPCLVSGHILRVHKPLNEACPFGKWQFRKQGNCGVSVCVSSCSQTALTLLQPRHSHDVAAWRSLSCALDTVGKSEHCLVSGGYMAGRHLCRPAT